jgi:hypothetical protein
MAIKEKIEEELRAVGIAALYFGSWILALLVIKWLVLAEYRIAFDKWSMALVGALILSKVVLVLEHVSLGAWVRRQPAWVDVLLRTVMYILGVALVLLMEKGFEARHEFGGFFQALGQLTRQEDIHHLLATLLCVAGALLGYNVLSVIRRHIGPGGLRRMLLTPLPEEPADTMSPGSHKP